MPQEETIVGKHYPSRSLYEPMGANRDRSRQALYLHDCHDREYSGSLACVAIPNTTAPARPSIHPRLNAITPLPT
jgi:hypothetical protein